MMSLKKPIIKKIIVSINTGIVILAIIFLILNLEVFYVSHASSGMIHVIMYETYYSLKILYNNL